VVFRTTFPARVKHFFPEPADADERELHARVKHWGGPGALDALSPERLRELTAQQGCDFTTALLHRRMVESGIHSPFLRELHNPPPATLRRTFRVVIVPGAFYRENPRTGADGRLARDVAQQLGLRVTLAPISSTGTLSENSKILAEWLMAQNGDPLVLVSISKGGGDVKTALARSDADQVFDRVIGWVNLCGILDGTPMADWLLSSSLLACANRFVYRMRGRSLEFLSDLRRFPGCSLDFPLTLPAHLRAIHVIGFPLRRHLRTGLARRCHARLASFGPNDGSILLADALRWPGQLCPVWAADHYLQPIEDVRPLLAALFGHLAR
jgi:hypothetical protein